MQDQWQACVDRLSGEMSEPAHKTYIKPLVFLGFDPGEGVLRLGAPSRMKLDIVRKQFAHNIGQVVRECFAAEAAVRFEVLREGTDAADRAGVSGRTASRRPHDAAFRAADVNVIPANRLPSPACLSISPGVRAHVRRPMPTDSAALAIASTVPVTEGGRGFGAIGARAPDDRTKLLADLTFANFVTGKANEVARAAALRSPIGPAAPTTRSSSTAASASARPT